MTEKTQKPENEETKVTAKPQMSKTAEAQAETKDEPKPKAKVKVNGRGNGKTAAEAVSLDREALLAVETYEEAETMLSEHPELIAPGRVVFGAVVPTTGQNAFVELAVKAAAEDDALTPAEALKIKREDALNLTGPEVSQLLEFADENTGQFPGLAFYIGLLLTDDLTRIEDADLWQRQRNIILATEKVLDVDALALWEEISGLETPAEEDPPDPPKAEAVEAPPLEKELPAPPPPPVRVTKKRHYKKHYDQQDGPPRWAVAAGFVFLLSMMSCGVCVLSWL